MKKTKLIASFLLGVLFNTNTIAQENNNVNAQDMVYCPDEVHCSTEGDIFSCATVGGSTEYWGYLFDMSGDVQSTYKFRSAQVIPGRNGYDDDVYCYVSAPHPNPEIPGTIVQIMISKHDAPHLKENMTSDTKWEPGDPNTTTRATCQSSSSLDCPFVETPGLVVRKNSDFIPPIEGFTGIWGNINDLYFPGGGTYVFVPHDKTVMNSCYNVSECSMDLLIEVDDEYYDAGNIVFDLNDNMKILSVTEDSTSPYKIMKEEPFNVVVIVPWE